MRLAIAIMMIMATAGTAMAQNLDNFKERPVKDTPTIFYVSPEENKQGGDTVNDATLIESLPLHHHGLH